MINKHTAHQFYCLILAAVLSVVTVIGFLSELTEPLDLYVYDLMISHAADSYQADDRIVVIAIDEVSIEALMPIAGKWSWPRSVHAELVETLNHHNANLIAFDILFAEPDIYRPDDDAYFNEVLNESDNVYLPMLQLNAIATEIYEKEHWQVYLPIADSKTAFDVARLSLLLPKAVHQNSWKLGAINKYPDKDGVSRRHWLKTQGGDWPIESLPKVLASQYSPAEKDVELPKDNFLLQWSGNSKFPFKTYSYAQVYKAIQSGDSGYLNQFSDKVVFIGATAAGLYDAVVTPINNNLPGVYIIALAFDNLINQSFLDELNDKYSFAIAVLYLCLLLSIFITRYKYASKLLMSLCLHVFVCAVCVVATYQLMLNHQVIFVGKLIAAMFFYFLSFNLLSGLIEYREKQHAVNTFGRFMDPKVVVSLLQQSQLNTSVMTKTHEVTVLFSDIRGFTSMSESEKAGDVVTLLNRYFDLQVKVIFERQGTLDKFIGDCIMAFWGAPVQTQQHAVQAITAALEMEENLKHFQAKLPECWQNFDIGIGIHTGEAVAGLIGTSKRLDYTVIGDTVNLASRIEGYTKGKCRILVSEDAMKAASGSFDFIEQGEFTAKGRHQKVKVYQPIRR